MDPSEYITLFNSVIYRAIGQPENWQQNSVEPLLKLLSSEVALVNPKTMAQMDIGHKLVDKMSEKETLVLAVTSVLDGARYGLLIVDDEFKEVYHNDKLEGHLDELLQQGEVRSLTPELAELVRSQLSGELGIKKLGYAVSGLGNVYLRSTPQSGERSLHYLMVANSEQNRDALSKEVAAAYDLSSRELAIVESAIAPGSTISSGQEIADELFISRNTLKTHLKSIYSKTGANSIASLVSVFMQHEAHQLSSYFGAGESYDNFQPVHGDRIVELASGQRLCYREYGDLNGEPVIVLHNNYSSRFNVPPNADDIASRHGRRIIIPDRPGYGKSPMVDDYPRNWPNQFAEFTNKLGLDKFDIVTNSAIVRHALEIAQAYPERIGKLRITSPLLHVSDEDKQYFGTPTKVATLLYEQSEAFSIEIFRLWHASMASQLDEHIRKSLEHTASSREQHLIVSPSFVNTLKVNFGESAAQEGVGSAADLAYCFNKTNMDLSAIKTPIDIWIGDEDGIISIEGVERTFEGMPNLTIHKREGYGEHIYYSLFEEVISA